MLFINDLLNYENVNKHTESNNKFSDTQQCFNCNSLTNNEKPVKQTR